MLTSNQIVLYSLLITIVLLLLIMFSIKLLNRQNDQEPISFPFRAIWKEMPDYVKQDYGSAFNYTTKSANRPPTTNDTNNTNDIYYQQLPPTNIREVYPISYTRGETIDRTFNVRPSMYGALTLRDTDHPYQDITTEFVRVGTLASVDKSDDTVMTLFRRDIAPERDLYEYKVLDKTNGNDVEMFLSTNTTFLKNGEKITIPGYENKGLFEVNLDTRYKYSRLKPIS